MSKTLCGSTTGYSKAEPAARRTYSATQYVKYLEVKFFFFKKKKISPTSIIGELYLSVYVLPESCVYRDRNTRLGTI